MSESAADSVADLLTRLASMERTPRSVIDQLYSLVYDELRGIAGRVAADQSPGATLRPTELVHEAYMRLVSAQPIEWQCRAHFLGVAALAMRHIIVDRARRRAAAKRGGGWQRMSLSRADEIAGQKEIDILELDGARDALAKKHPRMARVVELRAFAGLTSMEAALVVGVSRRTVDNDWNVARLWLAREMRA